MKINQTYAYENSLLEKVEHQEREREREREREGSRIQHFHLSGPTYHIPICFLNLVFLLTIIQKIIMNKLGSLAQ